MMKKIFIILVFVVLLSPVIEVMVGLFTPKLGDVKLMPIERKNYFLYKDNEMCFNFFQEDGELPLDCYKDFTNSQLDIFDYPNRPSRTSLDYNFERFKYQLLSFSNALDFLESLSSKMNLNPYCYSKEELLEKEFNMNDNYDRLRFKLTDDFRNSFLNGISRGIATNFDYMREPDYIPNVALNYEISSKDNDKDVYAYPMIVNYLILLDYLGGNAHQMFQDDCSSYLFTKCGDDCSLSEMKAGLTAKEFRKDFAEFFRYNFERMEFFEEIIDKSVKEDILYLSYYPGYERIWVVVKIPPENLKGAEVLIDGEAYDYDLTYPFFFVDVPKLEDGKHNLEIIGEKSYSIDFYVDTSNIFVLNEYFVIREDKIIMKLMNFYDKDVVIEKIEFEGEDIYCEMDLDFVVPYNVSIVKGDFPVINYTDISVPCDFSNYEAGEFVDLWTSIHWGFLNDTDSHVINGMWHSRVQ